MWAMHQPKTQDRRTLLDDSAEGLLCANCEKHPASVQWVGEGGVLDFVHGHYSWWCSCCALRAQLAFARKQARRIAGLEVKVKRALKDCPSGRTSRSHQ